MSRETAHRQIMDRKTHQIDHYSRTGRPRTISSVTQERSGFWPFNGFLTWFFRFTAGQNQILLYTSVRHLILSEMCITKSLATIETVSFWAYLTIRRLNGKKIIGFHKTMSPWLSFRRPGGSAWRSGSTIQEELSLLHRLQNDALFRDEWWLWADNQGLEVQQCQYNTNQHISKKIKRLINFPETISGTAKQCGQWS